jgi:hypothetical protein
MICFESRADSTDCRQLPCCLRSFLFEEGFIVCIDDGEDEIGRLIDVLVDVARILRAVPICSRLHQTVRKMEIGDVHGHLRDDDDLQRRIDLLHLADEVLPHDAAGDLEIHDHHIERFGGFCEKVQRYAAVRHHFADADPFGERTERVLHAADIEIFIFDQQYVDHFLCGRHYTTIVGILNVNIQPPPGRFSASRSHPRR